MANFWKSLTDIVNNAVDTVKKTAKKPETAAPSTPKATAEDTRGFLGTAPKTETPKPAALPLPTSPTAAMSFVNAGKKPTAPTDAFGFLGVNTKDDTKDTRGFLGITPKPAALPLPTAPTAPKDSAKDARGFLGVMGAPEVVEKVQELLEKGDTTGAYLLQLRNWSKMNDLYRSQVNTAFGAPEDWWSGQDTTEERSRLENDLRFWTTMRDNEALRSRSGLTGSKVEKEISEITARLKVLDGWDSQKESGKGVEMWFTTDRKKQQWQDYLAEAAQFRGGWTPGEAYTSPTERQTARNRMAEETAEVGLIHAMEQADALFAREQKLEDLAEAGEKAWKEFEKKSNGRESGGIPRSGHGV